MKGGAGCKVLSLSNEAICSRRGNGTITTCSNIRPVLENKAIKNTGFIPQIFTEYLLSTRHSSRRWVEGMLSQTKVPTLYWVQCWEQHFP